MSVLPAQFDASCLTFGEIKSLQSGAKTVNISYDGRPLVMQVSNLDLPYGLNVDDKFGPTKYSLNLSLRDFDSNPKTKAVFEALEALDNRVTSECVEKNWLRKPGMTQQILKQMKLYKPTVKFSEDENGNRKPYPPTVKVSLRKNRNDDKFETVFYDTDKKEIKDVPIEDLIVKRMTVTALIECTSVWISSVGCGLSWKAKQVKVVSRPDGVGRGYGFVDEDEPRARATGNAVKAPVKNSFADAFDDEEVDDEEVLKPTSVAATVTATTASAVAAEDHEPAALPKKTIIKKKVVVAK